MSDYKRLTDKEKATAMKPNSKTKSTITFREFIDGYIRLSELEDKICEGTLTEIPCNAGCTVYEVFIHHNPPFIKESIVEKIIISEKGIKLKLSRNSVYETAISSIGKTLFFTREEAEAKLKELQEKRKC